MVGVYIFQQMSMLHLSMLRLPASHSKSRSQAPQVRQVCDIVVQSMVPSDEWRHGNHLAVVLSDAGDHYGRVYPHPAFPPPA